MDVPGKGILWVGQVRMGTQRIRWKKEEQMERVQVEKTGIAVVI